MSVVDAKYDKLSPRLSFLHDHAVLAQAWKKTHIYIRRHNWYVDTLELDTSAVCLTDIISKWSESIADGTYKTSPAWLVPAPKSGLWKFDPQGPSGWSPFIRDGETGPVLRPLAHIGIKEQSVATAVMLCLADCIESAQGDTSLPPLDAAKRGVHSYGNRLFCSWSENRSVARFPWGNSNMYSRYFQDYQRFVDRPIATALLKEGEGIQHVFIVTLDVNAFFDNIDIDWLVSCLRREYEKFAADETRPMANKSFWTTARKALNFQWRQQDTELAHLFRDSKLPNGLPQGLASSGFFANAYLLNFDRAIGRAIERLPGGDRRFRIHDYCRYVDDLRLVVSIDAKDSECIDETALARDVSSWVGDLLKKHTTPEGKHSAYLRLNSHKTEIERLGEVGGDSRTAARMKALQQQLSGPFDLNALRQAESGLNGLLSLAELGLLDEMAAPQGEHPLRLASITKNKLEVRDDTLTRFSAYRLMRSLRMRRSMTDPTEAAEEGMGKEDLIHDFQMAARRLVAAWAVNPSLVQVLRYALDLFPSEELLEPISQALVAKVKGTDASTDYEERVVYYVLAELFKAGATETGHLAEQDATFVVADVSAYRLALATLAQNVLELPKVPWYVQQQASLLLASIGQATATLSIGPELRLHVALHAYIRTERCASNVRVQEEVVISLVGHQLLNDASHYISWFKNFCVGRNRQTVSAAWRIIGQTAPDLFTKIMTSKRVSLPRLASFAPKYLSRYSGARWSQGNAPLSTNRWIPVVTAMTHPSAPFAQENALLKLALMLAQSADVKKIEPELLTPLNLEVRSHDWRKINDPRAMYLELRMSPTSRAHDSLYTTPSWCRAKDAWMYAFGRILRAAATGEPDFTARHWLVREDAGWYLGLRSTWSSRRMGMLHTAQALRGTMSAITPWFSDLLLELLRWPGITEQQDVGKIYVATRRDFEHLVENRLQAQCAIYGESSNLPIYRYPVAWPLTRASGLRVALVQGLMPMHKDFNDGLAGLTLPGYRERHRNHTAALLHLVSKHLAARDYVLGQTAKPHLDLVVFPELTIHVNDQDLMRAFSDATGAILFYGLLGATDPNTGEPINAGRWLIPQRRSGRRSWVEVDQGKWFLTPEEVTLGIKPWRPYQVVIELVPESKAAKPFRMTGSICFDATDLSLAADLRDESHMYVVAAMNKDVKTFDGMVAALRYHMYQHVLIANIGEFGGSTAQAPYDKEHQRLISHAHGSEQVAISVFDVRTEDFGPSLVAAQPGKPIKKTVIERIGKAPPAGLARR